MTIDNILGFINLVRRTHPEITDVNRPKNTLLLLLFVYTVSTLYMEFKVWRRKKAKQSAGASGTSV